MSLGLQPEGDLVPNQCVDLYVFVCVPTTVPYTTLHIHMPDHFKGFYECH